MRSISVCNIINQRILNKILRITYDLKHLTPDRSKHFSFLVRKNNIISVGYNSFKTHPKSLKFKYYKNHTHSELACILNANKIDKKCSLINIRIDKKDNILLSKPCEKCQDLLYHYGINDVIYSYEKGFKCMKIHNTNMI